MKASTKPDDQDTHLVAVSAPLGRSLGGGHGSCCSSAKSMQIWDNEASPQATA